MAKTIWALGENLKEFTSRLDNY